MHSLSLPAAGTLSLIPTPPFPSYPSGHSTTSGAASTVLGALFPGRAKELAAMADEAAISRLYGGVHYRFDNADELAAREWRALVGR
jgi:membrane-associated phospholipid phosphatase